MPFEFEAAAAVIVGSGVSETLRISWGAPENVKPSVWYSRRGANFVGGCLVGAYAPQAIEVYYPGAARYHELLAAVCAFFGSTLLHLGVGLATGPAFGRLLLLALRAVLPAWAARLIPDPTESPPVPPQPPLALPASSGPPEPAKGSSS